MSLTGITGERDELPPRLAETVERVRASTAVPVAVGFGISTGAQAAAVAELADGVIVGSRIVRAVGEGGPGGGRGGRGRAGRSAALGARRQPAPAECGLYFRDIPRFGAHTGEAACLSVC